MSFVTGMMIIDVPASALNNSGEEIPGARTDNTSSVKFIRAADGKTYPYVSAQALRYWLRNTLESSPDLEWKASPVYREEKVAYTDANPIIYWDDDLLGYMRAPSRSKKRDAADEAYAKLTPLEEDEKGNSKPVTRSSPLRISTLVSLAPVNITADFGVMARQDDNPAPYEHQFYRTTLHGLFSLDLSMAGKFFYRRRTGFQNLDKVRRGQADAAQLEHLAEASAYRLAQTERLCRISNLLKGMGRLEGGAKQTLHYTDVTPAVVVLAVTTGGNHPFNYLFCEQRGVPMFQDQVLKQALQDAQPDLLSPVFMGWKHGYLPEERQRVESLKLENMAFSLSTPRAAFEQVADWLEKHTASWDK